MIVVRRLLSRRSVPVSISPTFHTLPWSKRPPLSLDLSLHLYLLKEARGCTEIASQHPIGFRCTATAARASGCFTQP
jgi:hypothetical protein